MVEVPKFEFRIVGKFEAHLRGNESHVFLSVLAGNDWEHLSLCGTLTMTEAQWQTLAEGLRKAVGDSVRLDDARV
ncbi:MAG: hypothetical protein ACRDJI_03070 [Actinomycetota bacterium]